MAEIAPLTILATVKAKLMLQSSCTNERAITHQYKMVVAWWSTMTGMNLVNPGGHNVFSV